MVAVKGVPEAERKLLKLDSTLKAISKRDTTFEIKAKVNKAGFTELAALKKAAEKAVVVPIRFDVENGGLREFWASWEKIRAATSTPITQKVRLEYDTSGLGGTAASTPSQQDITKEEFALRRWEMSHSGFWAMADRQRINALEAARRSGGVPIGPIQGRSGEAVNVGNGNGPSLSRQIAEGIAEGNEQSVNINGNGISGPDLRNAVTEGVVAGMARAGERNGFAAAVGPSGGSGRGSGADTGFLAGLFAGMRGGGGGGLRNILWGHGAGGGRGPWGLRLLLGGGALAGAGSLASFAGFGAEHFLFTGLGLAGSAGAGALGGGLIASGALGQMAVGSGSDMAVMKTTLSGVKELGSAYDALQKAVQLYGAHSKQAATAQAQLTLAMREAGGGKGAHAELAVAKQAEAINEFWLKATQGARVQAAHIMEQVLGLAHAFIPKIAQAAERNLSIIGKGLKPLFSWLKGPEGMGIWNTLENQFAHNLPTAMHAFDQAAQFVLKTIATASHYTGGFVEMLNRFFTKWNEPQNFSRWQTTISHLVHDFHLWMTFIKEGAGAIFDLFRSDAHTGNAIVVTLTEMLHKVREWENSVTGKQQLHNIFQVHKEEIIALLKLIPPLVNAFAPIYMTIAPPLVKAATTILEAIAKIITALEHVSSVFTWVFGGSLIAGKLLGFKTVFGKLGAILWAPFAGLLSKAPLIGGFFAQQESETAALTAAIERQTIAVEQLTAAYAGMGVAAEGAGAAQGAAGLEGGLAGIGAGTRAGLGIGGGAAAAGGLSTLGAIVPPLAIAGIGAYAITQSESGAERVAGPLAQHLMDQIDAAMAHHHPRQVTGLVHTLREYIRGGINEGMSGPVIEAMQRKLGEIMRPRREFGAAIRGLGGGAGWLFGGLGAIHTEVTNALSAADRAWGAGTPQYRQAALNTTMAAVRAIEEGIAAGKISAVRGGHEIKALLVEAAALRGEDPVHIASGIANSFRAAHEVTRSGTERLIHLLELMPPRAGEQAHNAIIEMADKWAAGHPRLEAQVDALNQMLATKFGATKRQLGAIVGGMVVNLAHDFGNLGSVVSGALGAMGTNVNNVLRAFGVSRHVAFSLVNVAGALGATYLGIPLGDHKKKQRGGPIMGGAPSGDSVPAMLERGEYVLNRNAVAAIGPQNLDAINFGMASRFQHGGLAEPHIAGPAGALRSTGQGAVHTAYLAALHYLGHSGGVSSGGGRFGSGKSQTERQLESLWVSAGGPRGMAHLMAAIAMAESGGNPRAYNSSGASGLWQIMMPLNRGYVHGSVWNPLVNARAALAILRSQGLGAWETYTNGAYRQYMAEGGLVGREERRLGVPQSEAKNKPSASKAVQWAMRQLGSGPQWGNPPGGWCGLFMGADMRAVGLAPPPGYPAAIAWSNYGTPLGKGNMQAGAIIDFGAQHVALAIDSGHMVSGDWGGRVATSAIPSAVEGTPITAVRWPPYASGPGAGSPISRGSASTPKVSIPSSLPKTPAECTKEIRVRREQIKREQGRKQRNPANARVIHANIVALERRIEALLRQRTRLLIAKRAKLPHFLGRENETGMLGLGSVGIAQRAYEIASEQAERASTLEPTEGNIAAYIHGTEEPAYSAVLGSEYAWRDQVKGAIEAAVLKIKGAQEEIGTLKKIKRFRPAEYQRKAYKVPALIAEIRALKELYNPGTHSGSLADTLKEIQGLTGEGGLIFQTQNTIRELGLKLKAPKNEEREGLLRELLTQANQKLLAQSVLAGIKGPAVPAFAQGGVVGLVGERGPEFVEMPVGARVRTASETSAMQPNVAVHIYEGEGRADVFIDGKQVEGVVQRMGYRQSRTAARGLATAGKFR